jgi:Family of unknown function (DUF5990)
MIAAPVTIKRASPSCLLDARIAGTAGDGGPACATVRLLEGGWKVQNTAQKQA